MAVPASATYNPNRQRIVQLALTNVGAIGPGAVTVGQDAAPLVADANDRLNILVKSMDVDGVLQWRSPRVTFTTVAGQASYTLPSNTYDVDPPMRYTISGQTTATQVYPMTDSEYMCLGDRTVTGIPIQFFLDKGLDATGLENNVLYFFPTPQNTGDAVEYVAVQKAKDQNTDVDTLDVPQLWIRCLIMGLTADLAPGYGKSMAEVGKWMEIFESERQRCLEQDVPHEDVQIAPFGSYYGYGTNGSYR